MSSATFYSLFADKEDCFLAAYHRTAQALLRGVARAAAKPGARGAQRAALKAIVEFAESDPQALSLLADEIMLVTRRGLQARDSLLGEVEAAATKRRIGPPMSPPCRTSPPRVFLGATLRVLVRRLRRPDRELGGLDEGLTLWLSCYEHPWGPALDVPRACRRA